MHLSRPPPRALHPLRGARLDRGHAIRALTGQAAGPSSTASEAPSTSTSTASLEDEISSLTAQLAAAEVAIRASDSALAGVQAEVAALGAAVGVGGAGAAAGAAPRARPPLPPSPPSSSSSSAAARRARAGLAADLSLPAGLREFWYPAAFTADVKPGGPGAEVELFGERWLIAADAATGAVTCCAAAAAAAVPSRSPPSPPSPSQRPSLPTAVRDGFVWVWPGVKTPPPGGAGSAPPGFATPPPGFTVHAELVLDVPCDAALLLENLLDLAHAPFTHTGTFAKGWPVPDAVRFHAAAAAASLAGEWDPYPISMAHAPPAGVLSTIGLTQPGRVAAGGSSAADCARHLHQLHVVLPAGPGRSRLLYRMAMDFWGWAAWVPGVGAFWRHIAGRVLGEDLVLVAGQQDRLARGGDVWASPVPYDKLAVRARRWRNAAGAGDASAVAAARGEALLEMAAGELLFAEEEEEEGGGVGKRRGAS